MIRVEYYGLILVGKVNELFRTIPSHLPFLGFLQIKLKWKQDTTGRYTIALKSHMSICSAHLSKLLLKFKDLKGLYFLNNSTIRICILVHIIKSTAPRFGALCAG